MPHKIKTIRLVIGAEKITAELGAVPPEFVAEVDAARADLSMMRGPEVLAAVMACMRSGLSLSLDLRPTVRITSEESRRPGFHRRA